MKRKMPAWGAGLLSLLLCVAGVSHSGNESRVEVLLRLPALGAVSPAGGAQDCAEVVAWVSAGSPQASTPSCQALRGQAQTYRLRWLLAQPDVLQHWFDAQQGAGQLLWFEFVGTGLRTQAQEPVASEPVVVSPANYFARLEAGSRYATTPSFVGDEALRLQNLLRIYRPAGRIIMAVIDSGVNFDDAWLSGLQAVNAAEIPNNGMDDDGNGYVDDVAGWDFVDEGFSSWFDDTQTPDSDPKDLLGHGTAVARMAAATAGPDAAFWLRILPLRVASGTNGVGAVSPFALAEAIHYATAMGARVINLSVGSAQTYNVVTDAINHALGQGVQVVVAAGNSSGDVLFPANVSGVFAVGALDASGQTWSGSARGTGVAVYLRGTDMLSELGGGLPGLSRNGTSYAAPLASGMAAMLWAVADGCEATAKQVRQFRPADQRAQTWTEAMVNRFESEAQGVGDLPGHWEMGKGLCGAKLTVAALLRGAAP